MIKKTPITHDLKKVFPSLAQRLAQEKDILFAYIGGSYGKGKEGPLSDIDIAIFLTNNAEDYFVKKIELYNLATEVLCTDEVDIIILNEATSEFAFNLIKNSTLLLSNDEAKRIVFETKVIREYQDFGYYRERMIKEYLKRIKEGIK
ncbi:MAG: nucleotidyltransferase domain-containing protein [candidate division WOR-3 bacterium]